MVDESLDDILTVKGFGNMYVFGDILVIAKVKTEKQTAATMPADRFSKLFPSKKIKYAVARFTNIIDK